MTQNEQADLNSAFVIAAANDYRKILPTLYRAGADIHHNDDAALLRASEEGHTEVVKYLLMLGARSGDDQAVNLALSNGHVETAKELLSWQLRHDPANGPRPLP